MKLITTSQRKKMLKNAAAAAANPEFDPTPVVKLYTLFAPCAWVLAMLDPRDPDLAFGIADLGADCVEYGWVSLSELAALKRGFFTLVERDLYFKADKTLGAYFREAKLAGGI